MRFALEVAEAVRRHWPAHKPLFYRISSVDGHREGWKVEASVVLARELKARGVDLIDLARVRSVRTWPVVPGIDFACTDV